MKLHLETDTLIFSIATNPTLVADETHLTVTASLNGTINVNNIWEIESASRRILSAIARLQANKNSEPTPYGDDHMMNNINRLIGMAKDSTMSRQTFDRLMSAIVNDFYAYENGDSDADNTD